MGSFSLFHWIVVGGIVFLLWNILFKKKPKDTNPPEQRPSWEDAQRATAQTPRTSAAAFAWPVLDEYDFEVVGESNYQPVLKALRGDPSDPAMDGRGTAVLVPEDDNPHDPKAVKVTVQGLTIGYLTRDDARSFRRRLSGKKLGMVPTSCGVQITGGYTMKDGSQAHFGAVLDLKTFDY